MSDSGSLWPQIIGIGGAVLGTIVGSAATHLTERNKHAREKTWEMKVEGYSVIVTSLCEMLSEAEQIQQFYDEDPHSAAADPAVEKHASAMWEAHRRAVKEFRGKSILFTDASVKVFRTFAEAIAGAAYEDSQSQHRAVLMAIRKAVADLAVQAKIEVRK